jgi:hypothetical protein
MIPFTRFCLIFLQPSWTTDFRGTAEADECGSPAPADYTQRPAPALHIKRLLPTNGVAVKHIRCVRLRLRFCLLEISETAHHLRTSYYFIY